MANGETNGKLYDGQFSFEGGVFSDNTKVIASSLMPSGVPRNALSWAINSTVRGGAVAQRNGFETLVQNAPWPSAFYEGGLLYQPDFGDPHLLMLISGRLWRVRVDTDNSVTNLSLTHGAPFLPPTGHAFLTQAEMFAVIQSGDLVTPPLFYDSGVDGFRIETLRQSNGFISVNNVANEIPPAGPQDYWSNRLWYAFGRRYCAGDIAQSTASGTALYNYRDSVLKCTENPFSKGGDGFAVPTVAGNIRALAHSGQSSTTLGESPLFVLTRRTIYSCEAPVTRADWQAADRNNIPLQRVALAKGGSYGDRAVVPVNSDLFFSGPPNGDIRSIALSIRNDRDWGNVPLSRNVRRALDTNDRSLLSAATGIEFDNRLLVSTLPVMTPAGIGHKAILALNFDLISTLEERRPPAWEGVLDTDVLGLHVLQLFEGDFGGRQRAFAVCWSTRREQIEIWEITSDTRFDSGGNRVIWQIETPSYNAGLPYTLKELMGATLWFDNVLGTVVVESYYRPDGYGCWIPYKAFDLCAARDCTEDPLNTCESSGYPLDPLCEIDAIPIALPKPPHRPNMAARPLTPTATGRPSTWGFSFQIKLVIRGWCRLRGIVLNMEARTQRPYEGMVRGNPLDERIGGSNA